MSVLPEPAARAERWRSRLTPEARLRRMYGYLAATAALYLLCAILVLLEIGYGTLDRRVGQALMALAAAGLTLFYLMIRNSHRTGIAFWKLAWAQGCFAVLLDLLLYAAIESAHAAMLIGMPVIIMFCALPLRPRQTIALSAIAVAGLALTSVLLNAYDPVAFPARIEAVNFILCTVGVVAVTSITGDLQRLRRRARMQAEDLLSAFARIERLATTDELTALSNRRHMHELLDLEERRQQHQFSASCIALIDVDHFKKINDRFGHAGGDAALRTLAQEARDMLRSGDTLARWGGEEFMLLMPDTTLPEGRGVVERMLARVRKLELMGIDPALRMTFSAGVAQCAPGERIADAIRRADKALYQAKEEGRDRVVAAA